MYKFEHQWGGEDTWYTKGKRWANKQKFPINHLALGFLEWLWKLYVDERIKQEMKSVDKQAEEILKEWEEDAAKYYEPIVEVKPSTIDGLDEIRIKAPWTE
jgi:predicted transcriptional regulator